MSVSGDAVERVVEALNAGDLDAFVACYAADATIEDGADVVLARGHDEIRGRYGPMLERYPQLRLKALSRIDTGPYVITEEQVEGRSPQLERHAVVYTLEDGLIARERILRP
jgi:hypothetical protein